MCILSFSRQDYMIKGMFRSMGMFYVSLRQREPVTCALQTSHGPELACRLVAHEEFFSLEIWALADWLAGFKAM
jgi:hypothetical protein